MHNKMRIAKFIANAGYCSRREAEKLIENKIVKINNNICLHPSNTVSESDTITVGKQIIKLNKITRLWKMYKPIKFICSTKDNRDRKKIFDLIPKEFPRIISVGRLDFRKFFAGLAPINKDGELLLFKKVYFFSNSIISFFKLS